MLYFIVCDSQSSYVRRMQHVMCRARRHAVMTHPHHVTHVLQAGSLRLMAQDVKVTCWLAVVCELTDKTTTHYFWQFCTAFFLLIQYDMKMSVFPTFPQMWWSTY